MRSFAALRVDVRKGVSNGRSKGRGGREGAGRRRREPDIGARTHYIATQYHTGGRTDAEAARLEHPASWVLHQALVTYLDDQDAERRHREALAAEAERGTFVSSAAMGRWVDSWDTAEELPPPEPDILPPR